MASLSADPSIVGDVLAKRFSGCLLGLAVGDALGGLFEARDSAHIREKVPDVDALVNYPQEEIWYTDDTQMAIGITETLIAHGEIIESRLAEAFVANYVPSRGYGWGARAVLNAMEEGKDYRAVADSHFPGGSFGNGGAMRVAPIGLFFRHDHAELWQQARASAILTHHHPLGIEGAQLLALAVAMASQSSSVPREDFLRALHAACESDEFRAKFDAAREVKSPEDLAELGNGIAAVESVPTAIVAFALTPDSYAETLFHCIRLGGDTDTIAAMAGAISGAYLGIDAIPTRLLNLLETSPKGRDYLLRLADQLFERYNAPRA